jgi:hypothetical protein
MERIEVITSVQLRRRRYSGQESPICCWTRNQAHPHFPLLPDSKHLTKFAA